jgi:predicted dehydrogenase
VAQVRIGIVGLHNHYHAYPMADYLARGIPGARLVAVADERKELARTFGERYCGGDFTTDYDALLARSDIDAVIVTSYTSAHADHVEAAAAAGKHVLLDKPIATTAEDAARIVAAGKRVTVMMAYLLRFLPVYQRVYEAVQQGSVGELVSAFYSIRVPATFITDSPGSDERGWYADPVRGGGGGFLDHGVHFTDFMRWFFGCDATSAVGRMASLTYRDLGVEDYGIATYTMESGAIVTVESTWHAADWYGPLASPDRCTLTGTEGEIELHYQRSPQVEIAGRVAPYDGRVHLDLVGEERYEVCYRNNIVAFLDAIRGDGPATPDALDGAKALEMVLAAYQSDREGRTVAIAPSAAVA